MRRPSRTTGRRSLIRQLLVLALGVWLLWPATYGGRLGLVIVDGRSMEPTYQPGDVVVTWKGPVQVGSPILLRVPSDEPFGGMLVIHRIVDRDDRGWVTQGDNSSSPDAWRIADEDALGVALTRIPGLGQLARRALDPILLAALAAVMVAVGLWPREGRSPNPAATVPPAPVGRSTLVSRRTRATEELWPPGRTQPGPRSTNPGAIRLRGPRVDVSRLGCPRQRSVEHVRLR